MSDKPPDPKMVADNQYLSFDGMTWPTAGTAIAQLERVLRYGTPTKSQLLVAASVLAAYRQLIWDNQSKRQRVIGAIRKFGD
jgi:hypothetical protein